MQLPSPITYQQISLKTSVIAPSVNSDAAIGTTGIQSARTSRR